MAIQFFIGRRSKQLEKLILSKPDVFDGYYEEVDWDDHIYEVSMKFGNNVDGVHSIYGRISDILRDAKTIKKCNEHNCCSDECLEKRSK